MMRACRKENVVKRIVVARDLTRNSVDALGRGIRLAAQDGAALRVIHVAVHQDPALHHRLDAEARIMAEELTDAALEISARVLTGDPAQAISAEAVAFGADLVLLGARGKPRLRDAIFGTTATHLARDRALPILIAQQPYHQPYARVLVATGDEAATERVLHSATALAPDAELFAVHAFELTMDASLFDPQKVATAQSERKAALDALVRRALPPASAQRCRCIAREGEVMTVLMEAWSKIAPDLLVIGTHKRRGWFHLLDDNRADPILLGCTSDILLVPME